MKIQYMKTKLLLLLILISASGFSQVIYSDEFDQGINNLNGNNRLTTSIENNNLKIVGNGTGPANCSTKSAVPSGFAATIRSMISIAFALMMSSRSVTCRGVKPFDTIDRSRKCFGSSMLIIDP